MYLLTVAVITMCAGLVYGHSSQCQKPDGKSDECISLLKCKPLREQLDKPNKTDQDLFLLSKSLTKLHCGSIRVPFVPKVCCPEPNTGQRMNSPPPCNTPDGKPGKCISLFSCPHLTNLLQPPVPQETISFVENLFRCVGPEEHSVCCGPPATNPRSCSALVTIFPPDRNSECCGVSDGVIRKRLGRLTSHILYQHPWAVVIDYELKKGGPKKMCAGALISARYVVTAAQCMTETKLDIATPKSVRLGEHDLGHNGKDCVFVGGVGDECNDEPISIAIETIITHPQQNDNPAVNQNDIALIRLKKAAPYTDFIRPICLPTKNLESSPPDSPLVAVSWFKAKKDLVEAPFVDHETCKKIYAYKPWQGLCAGDIEGTVNPCIEDDFGAPLVYQNQGRSELIGIASLGAIPCHQQGVPRVYTNIYEYIDWIKSHIDA